MNRFLPVSTTHFVQVKQVGSFEDEKKKKNVFSHVAVFTIDAQTRGTHAFFAAPIFFSSPRSTAPDVLPSAVYQPRREAFSS